MNVKIKKLNPNAVIPTYGSPYAAGADLYACIDTAEAIKPGETKLIKTGLSNAPERTRIPESKSELFPGSDLDIPTFLRKNKKIID